MKTRNEILYEDQYHSPAHFSFGINWQKFSMVIDDTKISRAKESLLNFIGGNDMLVNKTFLDVGCGSGLSSLVAFKCGAKKIVSIDVDENSVMTTVSLKRKSGNPLNWIVKKGSILNKQFIKSLGKFDVIYSWGVLHHTGNMYKAFDNLKLLVHNRSILYIAIYNNNQGKNALLSGSSTFWLKIKSFYNSTNKFGKIICECAYYLWFVLGYLLTLRNPFKYINSYSSLRGMDFMTDVRDWLGGYPYEYSTLEELINYFGSHDFLVRKVKDSSGGVGCHELLMVKI
jgi:2-polyprenyl-6-hydroxyphenyl methylase/3-demethylubiquinone-9 3-methyltransferase